MRLVWLVLLAVVGISPVLVCWMFGCPKGGNNFGGPNITIQMVPEGDPMRRWMMRIGMLLLLCAMLSGRAEAVCSGSGPTWTALSAGRTDVGDCVTSAVAGDTITVPV
jgi:hypothetical protein